LQNLAFDGVLLPQEWQKAIDSVFANTSGEFCVEYIRVEVESTGIVFNPKFTLMGMSSQFGPIVRITFGPTPRLNANF